MRRSDTTLLKIRFKKLIAFIKVKVPLILLFFVLFSGLAGGSYLFFYAVSSSSFFNLYHIEVRGLRKTKPIELVRRLGIVQQVNIFQLDLKKIQKRLESLPWIETAVVMLKLPDSLEIKVIERKPEIQVIINSNIFLVDKKGFLIVKTSSKVNKLPILNLESRSFIRDGRIDKRLWNLYVVLLKSIQRSSLSRNVREVKVGKDGFIVVLENIKAKLGWKDLSLRLHRLEKIIRHARAHSIKIASVDLTFDSDAVVKLSEKNMESMGGKQ